MLVMGLVDVHPTALQSPVQGQKEAVEIPIAPLAAYDEVYRHGLHTPIDLGVRFDQCLYFSQ